VRSAEHRRYNFRIRQEKRSQEYFMFCPRCGASQSDDLRFCKICGANLFAVRQVVDSRETEEKFDWSKTWVADMFVSGLGAEKRKAEIERLRGLTPEVKRYNEIKAGVITGSVGIAVGVLLYFLMQGIILGGKVPDDTAEILSRLWVVGIVPLMVGLALLINGVFISRRIVEISNRGSQPDPNAFQKDENPSALPAADKSDFIPSSASVTEHTTKHLKNSGQ
jgi:hypothetical protein